MYKKIAVFGSVMVSLIFWMLINYGYADTYTQDDLKNIDVRFCDNIWEMIFKKTIDVEPWTKNEVSFCIYNHANKQIPVKYWFTTATYNWVWTRVCQETTDTVNHDFTLIPAKNDRTVMLASGESKMIKEEIIIPPWITTWLQIWCLVAEIWWWDPLSMGSMFLLKVRKAFDLNIMVWGVAALKNSIKVLNTTWWVFTTNKQVKATVDKENNLVLGFLVENDWNVAQNVTITGKVYNVLWFQQEFAINNITIPPTSTNEITWNITMLPSYKWLFSIRFNIQNQPQLNFDITNIKDQSSIKTWYMSGQASIFLFSWILVVVLVLLVFVLYKIIIPRRAKAVT